MTVLTDIGFYIAAAFFEIFGCYAFWMAIKMEKGNLWIALGVVSLILFAWALAKIDVEFAGKAYAVYGGIYILSSVAWLWGGRKSGSYKVGSHRRLHQRTGCRNHFF